MILKDFNKKWDMFLEQKGAKPRTISFDFDDTLIQSDADYNYEGPNKFTVSLFKLLIFEVFLFCNFAILWFF